MMLNRTLRLLAFTLTLTAPGTAQALLLQGNSLVRIDVSPADLGNTMRKVVAGPDAAERARGLRTAIPAGTRLLGSSYANGAATIRLSREFSRLFADSAALELALEQINKSAINADRRAHDIRIELETADGSIQPLEQLLLDPRPIGVVAPSSARNTARSGTGTGPNIQGALTGRTIVVSPGHGYYWNSSFGWTTQRPLIDGLIEDIHTNEIAFRFLIPYLENMGAHVISCRERGELPTEAVTDNDAGAPRYVETGGWSLSASSGFAGGTYRFATTSGTETATATWEIPVAQDGMHPVYVWFRASGNRTTDARYRVTHSGGTELISIDQTRDNLTWVCLGVYHFSAQDGARVTLSNESSIPGRVVIADAVRVGGGVGSIARGGSTSGQTRWRECSRYWAELNGAPSSVWNPSSGDNSDDVTCRPRFAEWRGADAFFSLHTNAGGGAGTSSFIYNGGATAGSTTLQNAVHTQVVNDIRGSWNSGWTDRGQRSANFGEVRLLSTMPGVLLELAFHDTPGSIDHDSLHEPEFRRIGGRAIARGIMRYFNASAPFPPEPPILLFVAQNGAGGLRVAWTLTSGATRYTVEQSTDGKGFIEVGSTTGNIWDTPPLAPGTTLSFRVRGWNASGRSFPTEVLTAGTSHKPTAELLLVQGFDRLERSVKTPDNTRDYLALHADAIRRGDEFSLAFDAATNDAVRFNSIQLGSYRAVDWACGEESTQDHTFDFIEQTRVAAYLAAGGRLLVSGAEIGWDLEAQGSPQDRAFYLNQLGADYIADDANTYGFRGSPGGIFADIPTAVFDNGLNGTYDVDWPDVIAPGSASSQRCLEYSNGLGAGIQCTIGSSRVVHLGFPLETIVDPNVRAAIMSRALRFLLDDRALDVPAAATLGSTAPIAIRMPSQAGRTYALAASFGIGPLPLPNGQLLALDPDGLMTATLGQSSAVFPGFGGVLDASGAATAGFAVPLQPSLLGSRLVISGLTLQSTPVFDWGETMPWFRITLE